MEKKKRKEGLEIHGSNKQEPKWKQGAERYGMDGQGRIEKRNKTSGVEKCLNILTLYKNKIIIIIIIIMFS